MTILISHIPKTAGTSLRTMVSILSPDAVWAYSRELSLGNPNFDYIDKFRKNSPPSVLMGHFSYGVHRLLNLQPKYVTVLRNPIDRITSLFYYQKSLTNSDFRDYFVRGLCLHEFVSGGITEMTNNHACRMIAGIPPDSGMIINQRWLLDLAIHNLHRHYRLVGILENIDCFLTSLGSLLSWEKLEFPRENVTIGTSVDIDSITRDCIEENNQLDIELYRYVLEGRHL